MKKGLEIGIFVPWEIGIIIILLGIFLIYIGNRQSKKTDIDLNKLPFTKPTTKIVFGGAMILIGFIQLFPLLK
tara:strand:- start:892 stop:1110 length:219 start_codon:yes stop_codon:yes gene_type:complete